MDAPQVRTRSICIFSSFAAARIFAQSWICRHENTVGSTRTWLICWTTSLGRSGNQGISTWREQMVSMNSESTIGTSPIRPHSRVWNEFTCLLPIRPISWAGLVCPPYTSALTQLLVSIPYTKHPSQIPLGIMKLAVLVAAWITVLSASLFEVAAYPHGRHHRHHFSGCAGYRPSPFCALTWLALFLTVAMFKLDTTH